MFSSDQVAIDLEVVDHSTVLVRIDTPAGRIDVIGEVRVRGATLLIDRAHIDGPGAGSIGRDGLNAIGRKLLQVVDVERLVIQGSTRTTGRNKGRPPKPIRYPK